MSGTLAHETVVVIGRTVAGRVQRPSVTSPVSVAAQRRRQLSACSGERTGTHPLRRPAAIGADIARPDCLDDRSAATTGASVAAATIETKGQTVEQRIINLNTGR